MSNLMNSLARALSPRSPSSADTIVKTPPPPRGGMKRRRGEEGGEELEEMIKALQSQMAEAFQKIATLEGTVEEQADRIRELYARSPPITEPEHEPMHEDPPEDAPVITVKVMVSKGTQTVQTDISPVDSSENPNDERESPDLPRSLVIHNVPTNPNLTPAEQVEQDAKTVFEMTAMAGYPVRPLTTYRMPIGDVHSTKDRLLKVVFPASKHADLVLKHADRVENSPQYRDARLLFRRSYADPQDERRKYSYWKFKRNPNPSNRPMENRPPRRDPSYHPNSNRQNDYRNDQYHPRSNYRRSEYRNSHSNRQSYNTPYQNHSSRYGQPPNFSLQNQGNRP